MSSARRVGSDGHPSASGRRCCGPELRQVRSGSTVSAQQSAAVEARPRCRATPSLRTHQKTRRLGEFLLTEPGFARREEEMTAASKSTHRDDTTALLLAWNDGSREAADQVLARLYPELAALTRKRLRSPELSLQPSDLLQEVLLRFSRQKFHRWHNRAQFFALVARMLRRVLVDHQRARARHRRSGVRVHQDPEELEAAALPRWLDALELDEALERLAEVDPIAARTVELRFFTGLSFEDTAAMLELSRATAVRRWRYARAWLRLHLRGET